MTAIIAVATPDFIVLAGDKRGTYVDGSGHRDDLKKLYRINDKVIIGQSGHHHVSEDCLEFLQMQELTKATVQGVALKIRQFLRAKLKKDESIEQIVILGGIGDGNKITISTMQHEDNFKLDHIVPAEGDIKSSISMGYYNFHDYLDKAIEVVDEKESLNVLNVSEVLTKTITHVSQHDISVCAESDIAYIEKEAGDKNY